MEFISAESVADLSDGMVKVPHHQRHSPTINDPVLEPETVEDWTVAALRTVYDPEIPVNVYDIGLIYHIEANDSDQQVKIWMTLTSPMCPVADEMPNMVERAVLRAVPGIKRTDVVIVWEPQWEPEMMTEAARLELGMI
tara:strand:- start:756 stop:1172 length:417 start_codon:yes stop_codon:yes gene_type:complete